LRVILMSANPFRCLDNYASVVRTVHAYVSLIDGNLPSYHHEELHTIASTAFRFAEKTTPEEYATSLAEILGKPYARDDVLSASALVYGVWDADAQAAINEIVGTYMRPEKARVTVMLRDEWDRVRIDGKPLWEHGEEKAEWEKEKWYGTEYAVRRTGFSDGEVVGGLHLPEPNAFIAEKFDVEKKEVVEVRSVVAFLLLEILICLRLVE
jgi:insulysin